MNAAILATAFALGAAFGVPVVNSVMHNANVAALQQSLGSFRAEIKNYQNDHGENSPSLADGGLPQMVRPTDKDGSIGNAGRDHPLGPYLRGGIPVNPMTGRTIITKTDTFPPTKPSGNRGWLYHEETGQIVPDVAEFLGI